MTTVANLKKALRAPKPADKAPRGGLSTGSTLLNLACTGKPNVGLLPKYYYLLVGDSNSGKTFFTMSILAEAANNPRFNNHRLIYDAVERGNLMNIRKMFGSKLETRLEPPTWEGQPYTTPAVYSATIEDFFYHVDDAFDEGKPFIYILDSEDALTSEDEDQKFTEQKNAARKGRESAGSYGTSKAKANSAGIRRIISRLEKSDSILVIISQTRDNIGFGARFSPKTRSGGRALSFYAVTEVWTSIKEKIKKRVGGKDRQTGILCSIHVKRSRFTGREMKVEVPIYWSYGIDDVGSCIRYLMEEGKWDKLSKEMAGVSKGTIEELAKGVEENGKVREIKLAVYDVWKSIEEGCSMQRQKRYE